MRYLQEDVPAAHHIPSYPQMKFHITTERQITTPEHPKPLMDLPVMETNRVSYLRIGHMHKITWKFIIASIHRGYPDSLIFYSVKFSTMYLGPYRYVME